MQEISNNGRQVAFGSRPAILRRAHMPQTALALSLAMCLAAGSWAVAGSQAPIQPNQATITRCEPTSAYATTAQQAQVCIVVEDVAGLYGVDFEMSFPGMVGVATVVDEFPIGWSGVQILPSDTFLKPDQVFINTVNNSIGSLQYTSYQVNPSEAVSGSGPIACMRFQPSQAGAFELTFTRHQMSTRDGMAITNTAQTCQVTFVEPTSVTMSRFEAWAARHVVYVQWETAQETLTLGFDVFRAATTDGERTRLNDALIPTKVPPGSTYGASYTYADENPLIGTAYYWIEVIKADGARQVFGPVLAAAELPFRTYLPLVWR